MLKVLQLKLNAEWGRTLTNDELAENDTIGVSLLKTSPDLSKDALYQREQRPNNLLRWDVEVPANCNGEKAVPITYEFRMELDRQMAITGFQSK